MRDWVDALKWATLFGLVLLIGFMIGAGDRERTFLGRAKDHYKFVPLSPERAQNVPLPQWPRQSDLPWAGELANPFKGE